MNVLEPCAEAYVEVLASGDAQQKEHHRDQDT
jgi:hypothetical protein